MAGGIHGHSTAGTTNTSLETVHDDLTETNTELEAVNTKLDAANTKLQAIADNTDTLEVNVAAVNVNTDTLETLIAATNTKTDTGNASLSSVDGKLTNQATAAKQDTGNTSLSSIDSKMDLKATAAKQDTGNTALDLLHTDNGNVGSAPPTLNGVGATGILGYLRNLLDKLVTISSQQTSGSQLAKITNGTQAADTVASDSGQNFLLTGHARKEYSAPGSGSFAAGTALIGPVDASNFLSGSIDITTSTGGTWILQGCNDTSVGNWQILHMELTASTQPNILSGNFSAQRLKFNTEGFRQIRMVVASGTITNVVGNMELSTAPFVPSVLAVGPNISGALIPVDTELPAAVAPSDAQVLSNSPSVITAPSTLGGTSYDRLRGNTVALALDASSARTISGNGANAISYNSRGVTFIINVTAVSGTTPAMTVRIQVSGDGTLWDDLDTTNAQTASINATGSSRLQIYPGIQNVANKSCNAVAMRFCRLAWTITGTTPSFTFSTTASWQM